MKAPAPHLRLVSTEVTKGILIGNLIMKGAKSVLDETGLSIQLENADGNVFFVPQPLVDDEYYSTSQLQEIETTLIHNNIDLLPIDYNCGQWKKK